MIIQNEKEEVINEVTGNPENYYAEKIQSNILEKQAALTPIKEIEKLEDKSVSKINEEIILADVTDNNLLDKSANKKKLEYRTIYKTNRNLVKETPIDLPPIVEPENLSDYVNDENEKNEIIFDVNKNLDKEEFEKEDEMKKKRVIILNEKENDEDELFKTKDQFKLKKDLNSENEIKELKMKIDFLVQENERLKNKVENGEILEMEEINYLHRSKINKKDHLATIQSKLDEKDLKLSKIQNKMNNYQKNPATMKSFLNLQNDADKLMEEKKDLVQIKNTLKTEIARNEDIIYDKDQEIERLLKDNENLKKDLTVYGQDEEAEFGRETELLHQELREQELELLRKQESIIKLEENRRIFRQNIDNLENTNLFYENKKVETKITEIDNYPKANHDLVSAIDPKSGRRITFENEEHKKSPYTQVNQVKKQVYKKYIPSPIEHKTNYSYKEYIPSTTTKKNITTERKSIYNNEVSYPLKIRRTSNIEGKVYNEENIVKKEYKRVYIREKSVEYEPRNVNRVSKGNKKIVKTIYKGINLPDEDEKLNSNGVFDTFRKRD